MSIDHVSMTFHLAFHGLPRQPRSSAELSALYERPEVQAGLVYVSSRNDLTLGHLLRIIDALRIEALTFVRRKFVVLEPHTVVASIGAIDQLFGIAMTSPEAILEPFEIRLVDGRTHQPYAVSQVTDAVGTAQILMHPESISDDCLFLVDVFSYLKSIRSLMTKAVEPGLRVGFLRANDVAEEFE